MAQYEKLINLSLLNQFLTKAKTIFAPKITASGILKGDGAGNVSAATAGTDYLAPSALTPYRTAAAQDVIDAGKEASGLGLTGASVGDLVRVNAVDSNGKPTSWKHVPLNEIKCNRNLLDNWYFAGGGSQLGDGVFPINQRGQTSYIGVGYNVDRWLNSASSITTTVESDGLLVTSPISGDTWKIVQKFESSFREQLKGKTVTFSILFKELNTNNSISACIYDKIGNHLGTASYSESGLVTVTYTVPSSITDFRTIVYGGVVSEFSAKIIAVKLELGSEQTLCRNEGTEQNPVWVLNEIPDYGEELRKCQRYLYRYNCPTPHFSSTDKYLRLPIVHDFASAPSSIVESARISWYRIDGVQTALNNYTLKINDPTANSFNIQIAPTPEPGSSNNNKLGYISRLNVLVSAEL